MNILIGCEESQILCKTFREAGFNAFLAKPVHEQKLLRTIERLLSGKKDEPVNQGIEKKGPAVTVTNVRDFPEEQPMDAIRILLAEDNPMNRKLVERMLAKAGYRLDLVVNGKEAVEKYTADPDRFDLIFMDIQMPEMDGREATLEIRKRGFSRVPIIAMTAQSMKGDYERCLAAGMDDYIAKPIRQEVVLDMIKKWVLDKKYSC